MKKISLCLLIIAILKLLGLVTAFAENNNSMPDEQPVLILPDRKDTKWEDVYWKAMKKNPEQAAQILELLRLEQKRRKNELLDSIPDLPSLENVNISTYMQKELPIEEYDPIDESQKSRNTGQLIGKLALSTIVFITVLIIVFIGQLISNLNFRALVLKILKWLGVVITDVFLGAFLLGSSDISDGLISIIEGDGTMTTTEVIILTLLFFINIPLLFKNQLKKLATMEEFKLLDIRFNFNTLLTTGILLLSAYFLKKAFWPILGLFIVIFGIYIVIFKRKVKSTITDFFKN